MGVAALNAVGANATYTGSASSQTTATGGAQVAAAVAVGMTLVHQTLDHLAVAAAVEKLLVAEQAEQATLRLLAAVLVTEVAAVQVVQTVVRGQTIQEV